MRPSLRLMIGFTLALALLGGTAELGHSARQSPTRFAALGIGWDQCGLPGTGPCPPPAG